MNTMSTFSFGLRAVLYVSIAMATQAATDLPSAFSSEPQDQAKFWLSVILAGLVVFRAFIDRSSTEVLPNKPVEPVAQTVEKV